MTRGRACLTARVQRRSSMLKNNPCDHPSDPLSGQEGGRNFNLRGTPLRQSQGRLSSSGPFDKFRTDAGLCPSAHPILRQPARKLADMVSNGPWRISGVHGDEAQSGFSCCWWTRPQWPGAVVARTGPVKAGLDVADGAGLGVECGVLQVRHYGSAELSCASSNSERMTACAAASRAIGTRYGEQLT